MATGHTTFRTMALATVFAASLGLAAQAQTANPGNNTPGTAAQQINPSPMPPGSRAGQAPGMTNDTGANNVPGSSAQQVNPSPMVPGTRAGDSARMNPAGTPAQAAQGPQASPDTTQGSVPGGTQGPTAAQAVPTIPDRPNGSPQQMGPGQGTSPGAVVGGTGPVSQGGRPDAGVAGGTGAAAPTGQPDVARGTAPAPGSSGSPAVAQTTPRDPGAAPGGAATGATGGTTGAIMGATPGATTNNTGVTTPGASTQGGGTADTTPPAATTRHTEPRTAAAPVSGANSFTEGQARARIGDAGFNDVQELRLDDQGIWRGRAIREGRQTGVALDYQGNVVATQQ
jgi:hypothetical protein